jgi:hypothetical protein
MSSAIWGVEDRIDWPPATEDIIAGDKLTGLRSGGGWTYSPPVAGSVLNFGKLVSISINVNSLGKLAFDLSSVGMSTFKPSKSSNDISSPPSFSCRWVVVLLVKLTAQPRHVVLVPGSCGRVGNSCTVFPLKALMRRMLWSVQARAIT